MSPRDNDRGHDMSRKPTYKQKRNAPSHNPFSRYNSTQYEVIESGQINSTATKKRLKSNEDDTESESYDT